MTNTISIIQHPQFGEIRTQVTDDEPWFCVADLCNILDHSNPSVAIKMLDEDERAKKSLGLRNDELSWFVNESGLYNLIFRSNKPEAKAFRKWVTGEVLPTIRRTGSYGQQLQAQTAFTLQRNAEITVSFLNLFYRELMNVDSKVIRNRLAGYTEHFVNGLQ